MNYNEIFLSCGKYNTFEPAFSIEPELFPRLRDSQPGENSPPFQQLSCAAFNNADSVQRFSRKDEEESDVVVSFSLSRDLLRSPSEESSSVFIETNSELLGAHDVDSYFSFDQRDPLQDEKIDQQLYENRYLDILYSDIELNEESEDGAKASEHYKKVKHKKRGEPVSDTQKITNGDAKNQQQEEKKLRLLLDRHQRELDTCTGASKGLTGGERKKLRNKMASCVSR